MAEGTAVFSVGLGDRVTRPARRMGAGVDALSKSFRRLESSAEAAARATSKPLRQPRGGRGGSPLEPRGGRRPKPLREASNGYRELTSDLKMMGVAASITAGIIGGLLAKKTYELTQLAGSSKLAFSNMFGSERAGNAQLDRSVELANKFGLGLGETISQIQKFNSLGFTPDQAEALVNMGGDMLALGRSSEEVRRVFLQLSQIQAKGKLQGEELIVLAENGINLGMVYDRLGKKLGKTREEIIKMQGAGELKAAPALNSVAETILATLGKSKLGVAGEEAAAKTIGGVVGRIGTRLETGLFRAVQRAEPGLVRGVNAILKGIEGTDGSGIDNVVTRFLEGVGGALERIGPQLPGLADNFAKAFGQASGFKATNLESFAATLPGIATDLGTITGHFASLVTWAAKLAKYAEFFSFIGPGLGGGSAAGPAKSFQDDRGSLDPMLKYGENRGSYTNWDDLKRKYGTDGFDMGKNVSTGLALGIYSNMSYATDAAVALGRGVSEAARKEQDINSPSGVFYDQGVADAEGLAFGMADSANVTIASARSMSRGAVDASAMALRSQSNGFGAVTAAAAETVSSGRQGGSSVTIGEIKIMIDGAQEPSATGKAVLRSLELELADLLERHMQGAGAS